MAAPPIAGLKRIIVPSKTPKIPKTSGIIHDEAPISFKSIENPMEEIERNKMTNPTYKDKTVADKTAEESSQIPKTKSTIPKTNPQTQFLRCVFPKARKISKIPFTKNVAANSIDKAMNDDSGVIKIQIPPTINTMPVSSGRNQNFEGDDFSIVKVLSINCIKVVINF